MVFQGPGKQAGIGAQGPLSLIPGQLLRLPPGLEHLQGGQEPQLPSVLQPHPLPPRSDVFSHTTVSIRLAATTVIFSTTMAPSSPVSPMALHWQPE